MAEQSAHHNIPAAPPKPRTYKHIPNPPAPGISYFTPIQSIPAGTAVSENAPKLFQPLKIRGLTLQNRIILSPLCQYSATNGHLTDWHLAHLGGIISRGPGLSFVEATSVTANGRITPQDSGLWLDSQIAPLKRIVEFAHSQNQHIAIQLGHAGRKASTVAPWISGADASSTVVGGWPDDVVSPSSIPYSDRFPDTKELSLAEIEDLKGAWVQAVRRSLEAGFDVIEIHSAHGYLLHEFLSPVSNQRKDQYGGSFENRSRLLLELADITRDLIPETMPLFVRISATDWLEEKDYQSWNVEESIQLAKELAKRGVDLLDVSSAGIHPDQNINKDKFDPKLSSNGAAYQAPLAHTIKKAVGDSLLVTTVGGIRTGKIAQEQLDLGLDAVFAGRWFQKNPGLVFAWADELDVDVKMPGQIQWAFGGRKKRD